MTSRPRRFHFRLRFIVSEEYQPLRSVPAVVWLFLAAGLAAQIFTARALPPPEARAESLTPPGVSHFYRAASLGDAVTLSKALMLRLQFFDNQPGISIPFRNLDYDAVTAWLDVVVELDGRSDYPFFSAAKLYSQVPDNARREKALRWVWSRFDEAPTQRWAAMAHAAVAAYHISQNQEIALAMARDLRLQTQDSEGVPAWAKQMEFFLRANATQYDAAVNLLLRLVEEGQVTDPQEYGLLYERVEELFHEDLGAVMERFIAAGWTSRAEVYLRPPKRAVAARGIDDVGEVDVGVALALLARAGEREELARVEKRLEQFEELNRRFLKAAGVPQR